MIAFDRLFATDGFMPHGMCYMWRPSILAVHVSGDALTALAYFSIPVALVKFARQRAELRFAWMFLSFAVFIVACGVSHVMEIWTIWVPMYWLSGGVKIITALASIMTAILLARLLPVALRLPTPSALQAANDDLAREIGIRKQAEDTIRQANTALERRVAERTLELQTNNDALQREIEDRQRVAQELLAVNGELQRMVQARTAELAERESMLQEIHHRVKNNLQVIASLVNMQIRTIADSAAGSALRECQARIQTMALIHEMLYQSKDYARVPFAQFARILATQVCRAAISPRTAVDLQLELEDLPLPVDVAIPCALILNELISNALEHAFPDADAGSIRVTLRRQPDGRILLMVGDDGIGLSRDFDANPPDSFGVGLVATLVEQLGGQLDIVREPGATFRIQFESECRA